MPDRRDIQPHIWSGRGKAAEVLGQPFDVFRIGASATGDFLASGNKLSSQASIYYKATKELKGALEADIRRGLVLVEMIADLTSYQVGDVFINADQDFGAGKNKVTYSTADINGICLASDAVLKKSIGIKLNKTIQVFRSNVGPDANGYWSSTKENAKSVKLVGGNFVVGQVGDVATKIPAGIMALSPYGDRMVENVPGMPRKSSYMCYVPPLKGFNFGIGDRIETPDGNRYYVIMAFFQETSLIGSFLTIENEVGV